jgi:hypothetical protein
MHTLTSLYNIDFHHHQVGYPLSCVIDSTRLLFGAQFTGTLRYIWSRRNVMRSVLHNVRGGQERTTPQGLCRIVQSATTDYCYICKAVLAYYVKLVKGYGSALANGWLRRVEYEFICYGGDSGVNIGATLGPPSVRACVTFTWSPYGEVPDSLSPPVEGPGTLNASDAVTGHRTLDVNNVCTARRVSLLYRRL